MTPQTIIDKLNWRYAVKDFDPERKVPAKIIEALAEILTLTPSSFGLQPWKFFIISNPDILKRLTDISYAQPQASNCSHMVVFTIKADYAVEDIKDYVRRMADVHHSSPEAYKDFSEYAEGFIKQARSEGWVDEWSTQQAYIALGQFMTACALLGIDSCPMGGIDTKAYDALLDIKTKGYRTVVACPIGYRNAKDKYAALPKVRFECSQMVERIL